jgi:hypothetical protein
MNIKKLLAALLFVSYCTSSIAVVPEIPDGDLKNAYKVFDKIDTQQCTNKYGEDLQIVVNPHVRLDGQFSIQLNTFLQPHGSPVLNLEWFYQISGTNSLTQLDANTYRMQNYQSHWVVTQDDRVVKVGRTATLTVSGSNVSFDDYIVNCKLKSQ